MLRWREISIHLKVVNTNQRTSLLSSNLNSILRIKLRQIKISHFLDEFADNIVSHWYNNKSSIEIEAKLEKPIQQKGNHRRNHAKKI